VNRALRAATVGVLLLTPVALTACGVGQVNQTSSQVRDKTGPSAEIGDLSLRQVLLDYPDTGTYARGDSAQLRMSIVNSGPDDDALVGISGDGFDGIEVVNPATPTGTAAASGTATGSSAAASSATQTAGNSVGGGASNPTAASGSSTAAAASATSPTGSAGGTNSLNIPIPSQTGVFIGATDAPSVFLTGLTQGLTPAQHLRLTFTFQKAGQVTLDVTVSGPDQAQARNSQYNFSEQPSSVTGGNE
jgi:hypothetical protein